MATAALLRSRNDIDLRWPAGELLEAAGFETRVRNRVRDYLRARHSAKLSLRELMDLIVPATGGGPTSKEACWGFPPILDQRNFGWLLYISALLTLPAPNCCIVCANVLE